MSLILKYDLGNPHRLPVGYTPLAYVSMPGNTYINTGLTGNQDTRVYLSYVSRGTGTSGSGVFGGRISAAENTLAIYTAWSGNTFCSWGNTYTGLGGTFDLTKQYNIYINKNSWKVNDSSEHTFSSATFTTPVMFVGGVNSNGSTHASDVDFYKCTIWQNQTLIMDLIPAKRNSDEVIGMFDIVSQTFKTNVGTGAFIAGPEVVVLPYEYLLVEYLHATGSQWFDTGIKIFHKTTYSTFEISSLFSVDSIHNYDLLWGTPGHADRYEQWINSGATFYNRLANTYSTHSSMTANTMINYTCAGNVSNSLFVTTVNGSSVTKSYSPEDWNYNLYFLKSDYLFTGKVFNFKMTGNGTLIRNFIPCYRRSDLKPGMYDTVNNVFYTNSGSGEFVLGPVIEESSRQLEYNNAGSNYIGKPTNVHHSTSNPSTTQINEGSGHFDNSVIVLNGGLPTTSKTICFWMYLASIPGTTIVYMDSNTGSCFSIDSQVNIGASTAKGSYNKSILKVGWQHITIDLLNWNLYIDGVLQTKNSGSGYYNPTNGSNLNIGKRIYNGTYDYPFNGCLCDFSVYDNVLTADEVLQIYKRGL